MNVRSQIGRSTSRLKRTVFILMAIIGFMWLLEVIDAYFLGQALNTLGIWPRQADGLWGVVLMPLLHGGLGHLAANTLPFLVLGGLVLWRSGSDFLIVSVVTVLMSGLALWLFGSSRAVYIGASGLIFGYFGFLVFRGYFERSPQSLLVALLVVVSYGGLLFGLVPQRNGISWEAHLFGFLSGALCARLLASTPISSSPPLVVVTIDDDD